MTWSAALEMYQDVGMSNEDIIAMTTVNGAAVLRLSDAVGQLHVSTSDAPC
jgi:imidazolonepropionase-like amidohydrolase